MNKLKELDSKGFTLVELLAIILIISVIMGIAGYSVISSIKNSEAKKQEISLESIRKAAVLYVKEYSDDVSWKSKDIGYEYVCISINELVNKGYLKEKDISGVGYSNIQINRDIDSKVIIGDELFEGVCS